MQVCSINSINYLIPSRLDFCSKPEHRTRKQKDLLPDICYQRVRGLLFFNRHTPISNNKLKILLDTRRDLSDALSDASASRGLPKYFQQWLEQCHREFDREVTIIFAVVLNVDFKISLKI